MIFLNGEFIPSNQFKIESNDRGFLLSDGLFETMRVYNGKVLGLEDHYARLVAGAAVLKMPVPIKLEEMNAIILKLLEANELSQKDATLRITLTRGSGPRGLLPPADPKPTVMVTVAPYPVSQHAPVKLHISNTTRRNERSPLSNIKSLCYLDNVLAKMEAVENKADDAVLLNTKDHVASASAGNIFIVTSDNKIITPRIEDGILPGITRKSVIEICKENGIPLVEQAITVEDLLAAKEVFITNSIVEIQPVASINNQLVNKGQAGELIAKIQDFYTQMVKKNSQAFVKAASMSSSPLLLVNSFSGANKDIAEKDVASKQIQAIGVANKM
jgi:branched-chain amino acid aminotransferase